MRIPSHPNFIALVAGLLVATLALPAAAGSFYRYVTEDGGVAFTDDPKRVPARYQDEAEAIERDGFDDFDRYTHTGPSNEAAFAARANARLGYLRDMNSRMVSPDAVGAPLPAFGGGLAVRSGTNGQDVESYLAPSIDDGPVLIETVRSRPDGAAVTRHITIVRQGDRILSVTAPHQRQTSVRSLDERTLFQD